MLRKVPRPFALAAVAGVVLALVFAAGPADAAEALATPPIAPPPGVPSSVLSGAESSAAEGALSTNLATVGEDFGPALAAPAEAELAADAPGGPEIKLALMAIALRGTASNAVSAWSGIDTKGTVCDMQAGVFKTLLAAGNDFNCPDVATPADPTAIAAAAAGVTGTSCLASDPASCLTMVAEYATGYPVTSWGYEPSFYCFTETGTATIANLWFTGASAFSGSASGQGFPSPSSGAGLYDPGYSSPCASGTKTAYLSPGTTIGAFDVNPEYDSAHAASAPTVAHTAGGTMGTLECEQTGSDGEMYDGLTASFDTHVKPWPAYLCEVMPSGVYPITTAEYLNKGGNSSLVWGPVTTSTPYKDWRTAYPECTDGSCALTVTRIANPADTCLTNADGCEDWFTDPTKTDDWECQYGVHIVDLSECNVLSQYYKPAAQANGTAYADPATGDAIASKTSPSEDTKNFADPTQDPSADRQCFPSGWGALNPLEWVMRPVQCAIEWAFVPRASVVDDDLNQVETAWADTPPARLGLIVTGWNFNVVPTGCDGITVDVFFLGPPFQIMNACPGSTLATMATWSRFFGDVVFTLYGALAIIRHVSRVFGYEGPGSGGTSES
jgi:hypothetical protein